MHKAFTVIELIIAVAIISILSAVIFWNGRNSSDTLALSSAAEEVSLAAREAQTYGTTVRDVTGSGQFSQSYGVVFDTTNASVVTVFADANANGVYDGGSTCSGECVDQTPLRNAVKMTTLCATDINNVQTCSGSWKSINVVFTRPSLDAVITVVNTAGAVVSGTWQSASITLQTPLGQTKHFQINTTGNMAIQ